MNIDNISSRTHFPVSGKHYPGEALPASGTGELCSDNPFAYGYSVLQTLLMSIQEVANNQYLDIKESAERARKTQQMSNRMDEIIARAAKGDDKTREKIPDDVIQYMHENGISINGITIDEYIKKNGDTNDALDKGSLQAIKAALDNSANRDTDLMTQGQLTIQKMTQQMNAVITQLTGLLNKWGDICTQIAQKTFS
ncbi:hypothetical protein AAEY27_22280 [Kosakonia sp. BYX6]|uniref:Uncharacterized protein n=1 Tax=Kosakonia calanthes TaxID=3139408 RepID=A0ABZ3B4M2_9ENTR